MGGRALHNGHYSINLQFGGEVQRTLVLDSDGIAYYTNDAASNGDRIEFDVTGIDDDYPLPAAVFVDTHRTISASYSATMTPSSNPTSTSTSIETPTSTSSGDVSRRISWASWIPCGIMVLWVLW